MTDQSDADRLKALNARIAEVRQKQEPPATPTARGHHDQAHFAWRMVIELVAGIGVGVAIGIGLDALFGTRPFLLVLFTLLGFAAGVKTMLGTAGEMTKGQARADSLAATKKEDGRRG
jgi:ATP synthase protein I